MSAGGNASKSGSSSEQRSFIDPMQRPFLRNLYQQAQGVADVGAATQIGQQVSDFVSPQLEQAITGLRGFLDPSGQIQAQQASLQAGLGQLFREEINPAITSNAVAAGGLGGGRQGVAQGVAAGQLGQAYTQGLGDIVARANQTALGAAGMLPGLTSQYGQARMGGVTAGFDPLSRLAAILGSPTVLQEAQSQSKSKSMGFDFGLI